MTKKMMKMKQNRFFTYILLAASAILSGCTDDIPELPSAPGSAGVETVGETLRVSASMNVPSLVNVTRAFSDEADIANLHLYLVEFEDTGNPLTNTFSRVYEAENETPDLAAGKVGYEVELRAASSPKILHLVALPKGEELKVEFGVEATVIPALTTTGGTEAYWRRLSFPDGYCSPSGDGAWTPLPGLRETLADVGLIRNFAKITVTDNTGDDFWLTGFEIINNPDKGSVAPWNASRREFPEFTATDGTPLEFAALAARYGGRVPAGTDYANQITDSSVPVIADGTAPKYLYERPASDIRHTYIMLKGIRKGVEMYYKIDLGSNDATGMFNFYPLLRNFDFNIILNSVNADGYRSVREAAEGLVFNNLSFDLELSNLLNMSDGKEIVFVNFTTAVLTSPTEQTVEFRYRYKNLSTNKYDNDTGVSRLGLEPGEVISKITDKGTQDNWRVFELTIRPATAETKTQTFTIVKKSGLGRTVDLVLHSRWEFENLKVYKGELSDWTASTPGLGTVGTASSQPFSLFFDLPDNLPSAVFPMTFLIESDRQDIENLPGSGHMAVTSGKTLFNTSGNIRIQYKKVVTWTDYNTELSKGGCLIENPDGSQTHRVRCLFQTIGTGTANTVTNIAIDNENYEVGKTSFTRK